MQKPEDTAANVLHLWLHPLRWRERKRAAVCLPADAGTSSTKAEHEMSQIKKKKEKRTLKVSQPLWGETGKKMPHHSHATILPFGLDLIGAKCIFMK